MACSKKSLVKRAHLAGNSIVFWLTDKSMASLNRLKVHKRKMIGTFLLGLFVFLLATQTTVIRDLIYLLRPIWDKPPKNVPTNVIVHYYAPTIPPENLCAAHGWTTRKPGTQPRVIDAFIFSIELDMLEVRLRELWHVVDIFLLVEADKTFTGTTKPLFFSANRERFKWAKDKLVHYVVRTLDSKPKTDFQNEARMRSHMNTFVASLRPNNGDLIITSDIDELPYAHTIQLFKSCLGYPNEIHMDLNNYLYSFEFPLQTTNWKPHVTIYNNRTFLYHHGHMKSSHLLADAGWHCSFCFRHISDFVFKMTSYSHSDRVTKRKLLEKQEIQRKICEGADIFDMYPEAYTYKDLISMMGNPEKSTSTIGLPQYVVENPDKFSFLLPAVGECIRESEENVTTRYYAL